MRLIGQTLNPTLFATFREAAPSFMGFCLAVPRQVMFLVVDDLKDRKPTDKDPSRLTPNE
jgi:hypothetical protein